MQQFAKRSCVTFSEVISACAEIVFGIGPVKQKISA